MARIYARLILKGLKTMDDVPSLIKTAVTEALGLSGDEVK